MALSSWKSGSLEGEKWYFLSGEVALPRREVALSRGRSDSI